MGDLFTIKQISFQLISIAAFEICCALSSRLNVTLCVDDKMKEVYTFGLISTIKMMVAFMANTLYMSHND